MDNLSTNNLKIIDANIKMQKIYTERYKILLQLIKAATMISNAKIISNPIMPK